MSHGKVFELLLSCFELRRRQSCFSEVEDLSVEEMINDCVILLALKCNEAQLSSIMEQYFKWAMPAKPLVDPDVAQGRQLALLQFMLKALGQLQELFVPFAMSHLHQLVSLLESKDTSLRVRSTVLELMAELLRSEKHYFTEIDHVEELLSVLLAQIKHYSHNGEEIELKVVPPLVAIVEASGEESIWKRVVEKTVSAWAQSDNSSWRLAFLLLLTRWFENYGEHFISLLPQIIPFLAELMEDPDMRVEHACQKTNQVIQTFLGEGESIAKYFNT